MSYFFIGPGKSHIWSCTKPAGSLAVFQSAFQSNWHLSPSSRNVTVMMMCEMETRQLAFQTRQAGTGTNLLELQGNKSDVEPIQCKQQPQKSSTPLFSDHGGLTTAC